MLLFYKFICDIIYLMYYSTKQLLLKIYFFIQCIFVILNLLLFIGIIHGCTILILLASDYPFNLIPGFIFAFLGILFFLLYILNTVLSANATKQIISNKPLNKLQKFCVISFPIITIPIYLIVIIMI